MLIYEVESYIIEETVVQNPTTVEQDLEQQPSQRETKCDYTYCNEKALKCKPSALIFGRGRAKKSISLQGSYNIGIHVKIM